ncbi:MAG: 1-acyl-sn-glycerol-3-phosphate acyltransferase [Bacteroidales bacterium]|nr:1-acyl-sn-glycerol-3-phosphate acyltransferase [Bacteroidales bacterium]
MPLLTEKEIGRIPCARLLMRLLSVDKVNDLYDRNCGYNGPSFAHAVLEDLGIHYEIESPEALDEISDGPFITISNHPYGHLDGVMLVDIFAHTRSDYKVMANKFLGRIETLRDNFICVTPVGSERTTPTGDSVQGVKESFRHVREGHPLGLFPAGAVSDLSLRNGCVRDREWQEPVIRLIRRLNVPILPVTFRDGNSRLFYSLGLVDWRVRLLKLPSEVFNKRGRVERIALGKIITPQQQGRFDDINEFGRFLRQKVDELK